MNYKIVKTLLALTCLNLCGQAFVYSQEEGEKKKPFGLVSSMPQDTEIVFGLTRFEDFANEIGKSTTWKKIIELLDLEAGVDISDAAEPWGSAMDFIGQDAFFGFGKGTAAHLERLTEITEAFNKISYELAGSELLSELGFGGDAGSDPEKLIKDLLVQLLSAEDGKFEKTLTELQLPAFIAGSKVGDGMAAQLVNQLSALEDQLPPFVLTSEFDVTEGVKFSSWSIKAKDVFDDSAREQLRQAMGEKDLAEKLEKIIDSKKVEISFGALGDYLIVGFGPDHSHIKFVDKEEDSLMALSDFQFANSYADKKILAYNYLSKSALDAFSPPKQFSSLANDVTELLKLINEEGIDLKKMIPLVSKLGGQLDKATQVTWDSTAGVLYRENGLKWASVGGSSIPAVDADIPLRLAPAVSEDAFLLINSAEDPESRKNSIATFETMAEIIHGIGTTAVQVQGDQQVAEIFQMFDQMLRPKLLKVWNIFTTKVANGLGSEGGIVIDLKGSMPKVPGVPAEFIKDGKVPRISIFNSVKNRKHLAEAWEQLVPAINEIAAAIPGQEPGQEFQIPDTLSMDGKNLTTHFIGLPFVSNDFLPSLSISDELFFLTTSKKASDDLAAAILENKDKEINGLVLKVNVQELIQFAKAWISLIEKNEDLVNDDEAIEVLNNVKRVLQFGEGIKGFNYRRYKEDRWREDWHFNIGDIE
ncbi:MAG: hypothetical protein VYC09_00580 [Verrucomicrobiota bacterium]|nr:hypothetical protein [Verrucomicrobiota bacterium]